MRNYIGTRIEGVKFEQHHQTEEVFQENMNHITRGFFLNQDLLMKCGPSRASKVFEYLRKEIHIEYL
jgi:hypothetical protein